MSGRGVMSGRGGVHEWERRRSFAGEGREAEAGIDHQRRAWWEADATARREVTRASDDLAVDVEHLRS